LADSYSYKALYRYYQCNLLYEFTQKMTATKQDTAPTVVDSQPALIHLLDSILDLPVEPPSLYFDLEGIRLGRLGSISLISLHVAPQSKTYIVDVNLLCGRAFSTLSTSSGCSLKTVLENRYIPKVFFDVRNDSDALYSHYQISLNGAIDLQLLELATRGGSRKFVAGLAKCVENETFMSDNAKRVWRETKEAVGRLYDPKRGGRFEVFNERPLRPDILQYCTCDVEILPSLWGVYSTKLRGPSYGCWRSMIRQETQKRIKLSQSPHYDGQAQSKVYGPWDSHNIEAEIENWNDDVMLMGIHEGMVLDEDDRWVDPPQRNAERSSVLTLAACTKP
jgi:exonuclease 3'-5' domain-containing protein 1